MNVDPIILPESSIFLIIFLPENVQNVINLFVRDQLQTIHLNPSVKLSEYFILCEDSRKSSNALLI